jgi:hypothetical protein
MILLKQLTLHLLLVMIVCKKKPHDMYSQKREHMAHQHKGKHGYQNDILKKTFKRVIRLDNLN